MNPPAGGDYADGRDYFRVESDGVFNGARRKVQAIFVTQDMGIPKSYYATKDIILNGGLTITNFSLFSRGNVEGLGLSTLTGTDTAYGNWKDPNNPYNNKARLGNATSLATVPGVGAEGTITYTPASTNTTQRSAPTEATDRYKRLDFDSGAGTATPSPNYKFCGQNTPSCWPTGSSQPSNVISYPFNEGSDLDANLLRAIAEQQIRSGVGPTSSRDNYVEQAASAGVVDINETTFNQTSPALSSVFVVRFTGATAGSVNLNPSGASSPCPIKGIIVVVNGSLRTSSSGARCFDGVISIQDPNALGTLEYRNNGNFTLNGFVNVDGSMTLAGSVNPLIGNDVLNMPGYHDIRVWSWRECYNTTCS